MDFRSNWSDSDNATTEIAFTVKSILKEQLKCPYMTGSLTWERYIYDTISEKMSPDHRVSSLQSVPWRRILLHIKWHYIQGGLIEKNSHN